MIGRDKMKDYEAVLEDPPVRLFDVSDFEVLAAVKEVMHNNIEDKWWSAKLVDDSPDEDGNMKSKYVMKYEEELKTPKPTTIPRQLILDIKIAKVSTRTSVKLNYQVASDVHRHVANGILEKYDRNDLDAIGETSEAAWSEELRSIMNKLILSISMVTLFALPAGARPHQQPGNSVIPVQQQTIAAAQSRTNEGLLQGTEFENKKQNTDNPAGMGDSVFPSWHWYQDEKAQIDLQNKHGFWGNDPLGNTAADVTNTYIAPAWNAVNVL